MLLGNVTTPLVNREDVPLQVVLEVPDHDGLLAVLDAVSDIDIPVQTENIRPATIAADASVTINLGVLTEKQRETLELALEQGYYDRPRESELEDLAAHLDISKSAVSQRLRGAELKLIKNALGRYQ